MPKRIYVGNLPFAASDEEVRNMFEEYGTVESCRLSPPRGREDPRTAEVVMKDDGAARRAIAGVRGKRLGGRNLDVK